MISSQPDSSEEAMDTSELIYDDFNEEGEIHSSGDEQNERLNIRSKSDRFRKSNFEGLTSAVVTAVHKTEELKKLERAKRFAIPVEKTELVAVNNENLARLHKSLGVDTENERHYRFNAIHMRGTQDMSTEDVFDYFQSFTPSYIEWINDVSCNVVWVDDVSAARALLNLSKEIKNLDKIHCNRDPFGKDFKDKDIDEDCSSDDDDDDVVDARHIKVPIPPGHWRVGVPCERSSGILLRLATRSDRKQKNAEKNSEYYKRYGNPHFGNLPGIVSKSLRDGVLSRKHKRYQISEKIEDNGNDKKNPWGHIAQEWNAKDKHINDPKINIRSRISLKRSYQSPKVDLRLSINKQRLSKQRQVELYSSYSDNDSTEMESRVKFPRMKMYADDEETSENKKIRKKVNSEVNVPFVEDLRNKIDRKRKNKERLKHSKGSTSKREWNKFDGGENDEDDYYDYEEKESHNWALEQYSDLRESLEQNRKFRTSKYNTFERSESEDSEVSESNNELYNGHLCHRSPLKIEIENDEYFEDKSEKSL